jgi:hypothetical protein
MRAIRVDDAAPARAAMPARDRTWGLAFIPERAAA